VTEAVVEAPPVEAVKSPWSWAAPGIMVIEGAADWGQDAIQQVQNLVEVNPEVNWEQTTVANNRNSDPTSYKSDDRDCDSVCITRRKELSELDGRIHKTAGFSLGCYLEAQGYAMANIDSGYDILRYREGQKFVPHVDATPASTASSPTGHQAKDRQLTLLAYLNEDYEGGELFFPSHNLTLRPKAGDVVVFPSNFAFPHEAKPTTKGERFVVVTWFFWKEPSQG